MFIGFGVGEGTWHLTLVTLLIGVGPCHLVDQVSYSLSLGESQSSHGWSIWLTATHMLNHNKGQRDNPLCWYGLERISRNGFKIPYFGFHNSVVWCTINYHTMPYPPTPPFWCRPCFFTPSSQPVAVCVCLYRVLLLRSSTSVGVGGGIWCGCEVRWRVVGWWRGGPVDRGEMGCKDKYSYFPPPPHLAASHPANTNTTNTVPLYWKIDKQDEWHFKSQMMTSTNWSWHQMFTSTYDHK